MTLLPKSLALISTLSLSLPVSAQATKMPLQDAPLQSVLTDDDDGRVEIVPTIPSATSPVQAFHDGAILQAPQVQTLYWGNSWNLPHGQKSMHLLDGFLISYGVSEGFASYKSRGLDAFSFPVVNDGIAPTPPGMASVSDLTIQHFLHDAFLQGRLATPTENSVVVVFLAPSMKSTLNDKRSGEAFLAYHSSFHDNAGLVRYVVVPFGTNVGATRSTAEKALTLAILNPDGNGWY